MSHSGWQKILSKKSKREEKLRIKKIEVVGTENEDVIIFGDIDENDMIVVSTLNTGYEGMELTPMKLENKEAL